ncbi:aminotransferase class IV [Kitasatospora sp. NPDC088346]|uniref:aminotransferase class IV n=1 Tax=Kitasatospora sp. NPDC088346 TaxID=3364073 RepID=UPI003810A750
MIELNGEPALVPQVAALALTNYGHFTTLRVEDGRVRGLGLHLARLVRDCRLVFGTELDPELVRTRLREALGREALGREGAGRRGAGPEGVPAVTVRVTVFDPALGLERPGGPADPQLLVTTRPAVGTAPPPLRVRTVEHRRDLPEVKHTGLFGLLHQRRLAQLAGFDDALLTGAGGLISEGTTWNVLFHDGRHLVAPEAECLPGVTEALLAAAHGGPRRTEPVTADGLERFVAAFATNAGFGIRPIAQIDGVRFDPAHPLLGRLRAEYLALPAEEV